MQNNMVTKGQVLISILLSSECTSLEPVFSVTIYINLHNMAFPE